MSRYRKQVKRRAVNAFRSPGLHPVLEQVYAGRHITSIEELDYRLERLIDPGRMPGLVEAVTILEEAVRGSRKVLFVGDFDADGATSTAVGVLALKAMGARQVDYLVPDRFEFGYGLSPEIVRVAAGRSPEVLVTVDNGISSIQGVDAARACGMSVVVTDHHLPGERLPAADAIVNPNLTDSSFPSSALAGVGVIFYVMIALRARLRQTGWLANGAGPNLADLLDLVAVGTVADLVPLDENNRILVGKGLERINDSRCRPGIRALLKRSGLETGEITAADLGYVVAPRLNAAGRLTDMSLGIECLLAEDHASATKMAGQLDRLNQQRREIEADMRSGAMEAVEHLEVTGSMGPGICLYDVSWHQGIVGLIAGRVKDRLNRPVAAFAKSDSGELKGSVRSVPGVHIRDVLTAINTRHPDMIARFGGHAAAAGLSLDEDSLPGFETAFSEEIDLQQRGKQEAGVIYTDGALNEDDICVELARLLKRSGPWGQGFPEPEFDDDFEVVKRTQVGAGGHHLKLKVRKKRCRKVFDAIAFYQNEEHRSTDMSNGVKLVYRLDINEYNGSTRPQLVVQYLEGCAEP